MQLAQLRPRLDAHLLDEHASRHGVDLEHLGLPAAAVQREHELAGELLAQRVVIDELLQLAHDLGMATGGEIGFHAKLQRGQSLLLQTRDLGGGERLDGQLGERRAAPQRQRLAQGRGSILGSTVCQHAACVLDEALEAFRVELSRLHAQAVAGRRRGHDLRVAKCLAQPRDVHLHRLHGAAGSVLAP